MVPELHRRRQGTFEHLSAGEVERRSLTLLRHSMFVAYHCVPYYKKKFDEAGANPRDLRTRSDLRHFPLLTKQDIREHEQEMISMGSGLAGARWNASGGSAGTPVRFIGSRLAATIAKANEYRMWRWYGVNPGAKQAFIWGADYDIPPDRFASRWKNRALGVRWLNAFHLNEQRCQAFAEILSKFQPEIIYGYATALARFARYVRETRVDLLIAPRAIRSTAEVLLPDQRALIEASLHGPVYDYYGSRDAGPLAGECSLQDGLHTFPDVTYVEILRPNGDACAPGEIGEIVVTKLHEHAMPFIRYRIGDRAAWQPGNHQCRIPFSRISSVQGRIGDFVLTPDGREIHAEFFSHLFYGAKGVVRFQVQQPTPSTLRILVQTTGEVDESALESIRRSAAEHFDVRDPGRVTLHRVERIDPGPSGKHRFVLPYEDR
jgi:phenylacetate-CoA ligase